MLTKFKLLMLAEDISSLILAIGRKTKGFFAFVVAFSVMVLVYASAFIFIYYWVRVLIWLFRLISKIG